MTLGEGTVVTVSSAQVRAQSSWIHLLFFEPPGVKAIGGQSTRITLDDILLALGRYGGYSYLFYVVFSVDS